MHSLSIFLLKKELATHDEAIKSNSTIRRVTIGHGRGAIGVLYHRTTPSRPPRWIMFFGSHVNPRDFLSSSASAVLVVRAAGRMFALAFGYGRHLLKPGSYEENFGLRVTLNSVSPDQVRTVDRKALDATGRHSREQATRNIPIIEFGLDVDKDILQGVTGPPEDLMLGTRFAGADALSVIAEVELHDLRNRLPLYLAQYQKQDYLRRFPWVDNIREVGDPSLCQILEAELEGRIQEGKLDRIWMAVPDLVDWQDVAGFTFSIRRGDELLDDISFEAYLGKVRDPTSISIGTLRRDRVRCMSAETDLPKSEWSVYKCVYAELDRDGRTFLLNGGRWYEVAANYVKEVDRAIHRLQASSSVHLPVYQDAGEREYNSRVHQGDPSNFALMDGKSVRYGGGSSQIEFCDLYARCRTMVHVKRYGGSGTLSHLFAQGSVSANLFLNDEGFRKTVNARLPATHRLGSVETRPQPRDYEVAYAIASKAHGPLVLPFFSRVTLRSVSNQLQNMGFRVTLTKIACQ